MASYKLLLVLTCLLMTAAISCDLLSGEKDMPIPLNETMENTGILLQFNSLETFDLIDGIDAQMNVELQLIDYKGGENIKGVDLYLYSMSVKGGEYKLNPTDDPVKLIELPTDPLEATDDGLHGTYTIPLNKVIENLPVEISFDDIMENDSFGFQWRITASNGLTFTETCGGIRGGIYQPYRYCSFVRIVYSLPEGFFEGNYRFSQQNEATFGPVYTSMTFEAELRDNPHEPNGRLFDAEYLGQFSFGVGERPQPVTFLTQEDTANNSVTLSTYVGAGLGCSALGLFVGPEREHNSHFERSDDSSFTLGITENTEGDCGGTPVQVVFDVEKL